MLGTRHPVDRAEDPLSADRRLQALALAAGIAGIGVSVYLTVVHYTSVPLVCTTVGAINCEAVLTSPYSVIAGTTVPTSAAGIVWFLVSCGLAVLRLRNPASRDVSRLQLAWSAIGLVTVVGLVFIEIVVVGAICIWCTTAHVLVVGIGLISLSQSGRGPGRGA